MNRELAHKVADAVLYEGYMLYPYRPTALKNRQRWTFGILYPPEYQEVRSGSERSQMHTECLVEAGSDASVGIEFRFLQLVFRRTEPSAQPSLASEPSSCFGQELKERSDEGVERTVELEFSLNAKLQPIDFRFPRPNQHEQPPDANTQRTSQTSANELRGKISVDTEVIRDGVWKLKIDVANTSPLPISSLDRNSALRQSLLSAHMILTASKANFISLLDPLSIFRMQPLHA